MQEQSTLSMSWNPKIFPNYTILLSLLSLSTTLTYYYGDGSYFAGTVDSDGRPQKGSFYREDFLIYYGNYEGGLYHGTGSWYGAGGESYQGQFRGGEASGRGVWTSETTGERVWGQFERNMVSGRAFWYRPGLGVKLEGVFKVGFAHGPGVVSWDDTAYRSGMHRTFLSLQFYCRFSSVFKKGRPHGKSTLYYPNNTIAWKGQLTDGAAMEDIDQEQHLNFLKEHPFRSRIILTKL